MISASKDVDNGPVIQRNVFGYTTTDVRSELQILLAAAAAVRVLHISRRRVTALYSCKVWLE